MEETIRTLAMLEEGECARVCSLCMEGALSRRLADMGLIEGTLVHCLQKSHAGGLAAYRIRGAVIALRRQDAGEILVQ